VLLGGAPVDARAIMPSLDALKAAGLGGHSGGPQSPAVGDLPQLPASATAAQKRGAATGVRAVPLPRQEDAQEYLTHLLDAADCELGRLADRVSRGLAREAGAAPAPAAAASATTTTTTDGDGGGGDEGGWVTAGRTRRAAAVTRGSGLGGGGAGAASDGGLPSPLPPPPPTAIRAAFGGLLRSEVRTGGRAPPSATLQPFTVLSLDAGAPDVACIPSALDALTRAEPIEGYRLPGGQPSAVVRATKSLSLAAPLPAALLLHLNRFSYDGRGGGKLRSPISAPATLRLKGSWLAAGTPPARYALVSVVAHHGPGLASGHYTAAVAQQQQHHHHRHQAEAGGGDGPPKAKWLVFDDADVSLARHPPWEGGFGGGGSGGDAYLVVYERAEG
jgi:hypothetical protein